MSGVSRAGSTGPRHDIEELIRSDETSGQHMSSPNDHGKHIWRFKYCMNINKSLLNGTRDGIGMEDEGEPLR